MSRLLQGSQFFRLGGKSMDHKTFRYLAVGISVVTLVALWVLFGPTQLGGSVTYVTTHGNSMEPKMQAGDLALVKEADSYETGDVVAYRSENLDRLVLHRIVRATEDRFILKGDGNDWIDSERPRRDDIVGKLWLRGPAMGGFVQTLRAPSIVAVAAGIIVFLYFVFRNDERTKPLRVRPRLSDGANTDQLLITVAVTGGIFMLLAGLSFTRPVDADTEDRMTYRHEGRFDYSADAPRGPVYPRGEVTTGDPVFLRLVDSVDIDFDYELRSDLPLEIEGEAHLVAHLGDPTGWHRTFELSERETFDDRSVRLEATLDLGRVRDLIDRVEIATSLPADSYPLTIVPQITIAGTMGAHDISDEFAPRLDMRLDALQLLQVPPAGYAPGTEPSGDPLRPSLQGSVTEIGSTDAYLTLLGMDLRVAAMRMVSIVGLIASLLVGAGLYLMGTTGDASMSTVPRRYRSLLVPIAPTGIDAYDRIVEVNEIDPLAAIARQRDRMLLTFERDGARYVLLDDGAVAYVARIPIDEVRVDEPVPVVEPR